MNIVINKFKINGEFEWRKGYDNNQMAKKDIQSVIDEYRYHNKNNITRETQNKINNILALKPGKYILDYDNFLYKIEIN